MLAAAALAALLALPVRGQHPAQNEGAAGAWQKILTLQTTASVMHTTAHPDDEHGGLLAMLSRGQGATVSMLTLTRGESGDNAIGPELFDAVGLIRTEELLVANRYYGVDRQYFSTAVDYGFSKRLDEALEKWGREDVVREMVRIIRTERPFVIVSRFQGNARDGHGNHQAAGLLTQQAVEAAADPALFKDQLAAGLRPWQALKLYMGGVRENEDWTLRVDTGTYDAVLGESYQTFGRLGLSFQRSQTAGRFVPQAGPSIAYYKRLASVVDAPAREQSFFDGIDTSIRGLYRGLRRAPPAGADTQLASVQRELEAAKASFTFPNPASAVPALARGWQRLGEAIAALGGDPDVKHVLEAERLQVEEAIHASLGIALTAVAQPVGTPESGGPFAAGPPPTPAVVPGAAFDVRVTFVNRSDATVNDVRLQVEGGEAAGSPPASAQSPAAAPNAPVGSTFTVRVPDNARPTRPAFSRRSLHEARYSVSVPAEAFAPSGPAPFQAIASYTVHGIPLTLRRPVTRFDANPPYGQETRTLTIVPALAVTLTPAHAIVMPGDRGVKFTAEVLNNRVGPADGTLALDVPAGWKVSPRSHSFTFARGGERRPFSFLVHAAGANQREQVVTAVVRSGGREYREGYVTIRHRDLDTRYLYRDAAASVRSVDVRVPPGLRVGYVMGIGDEVPAASRSSAPTCSCLPSRISPRQT
jgi:LmbE family N-acetylglucosaminyl deacetylase